MTKNKTYKNSEIKILWQPDICIHCGECAKGLSSVFQPRQRPWINMEGAPSDQIADQVANCPSGAISVIKD
jgi:uncharacterized Fe-S cluster protein YjdI